MPSNVLSIHLKETFPPIIWIFTEGVGIESRLPFKIFSTLQIEIQNSWKHVMSTYLVELGIYHRHRASIWYSLTYSFFWKPHLAPYPYQLWNENIVTIICQNDDLSLSLTWLFTNRFRGFNILFAEINQILLKISIKYSGLFPFYLLYSTLSENLVVKNLKSNLNSSHYCDR